MHKYEELRINLEPFYSSYFAMTRLACDQHKRKLPVTSLTQFSLTHLCIPVNSTDLSSTLLISDPKNAVYWLSTWFEEIYWLATDFADFEKFSIFFSASRSVCSLQCISPDPITVVIHPYHQGVHS